MNNLIPCSICGNGTSFERFKEDEPREGEVCGVCDRWVCHDCVDWVGTENRNDEWIVCKECSKEQQNKKSLILNIHEVILDDTGDLALIYGECPYCHGLFGVDWTYLDQVDNIVHCPMCCMEVDFGEEE